METMIGFEVPRFLGFFTVLHTFLRFFRSKNLEKQISQGTDALVLQVHILTRIMVHLRLSKKGSQLKVNPKSQSTAFSQTLVSQSVKVSC
jgi:hypothetical protein